MDSIQLRQERAKAIEMARLLVDRAEVEKRDLDKTEQREFERFLAKADALADLIAGTEGNPAEKKQWEEARGRGLAAVEGFLKQSLGTVAAKRDQPGDFDGGAGLRALDGREVRMLGPEQRLFSGGGAPSLGKMLRGLVTGNWRGAEEEKRALQGATDSLGGFLVPDPLSRRVIDLARAKARVIEAGALTVPMESASLKFARVTSDPIPGWRVENQPIPASGPTFGLLELNARTLGCLVKSSVEIIEDGINMPDLVESVLAQALALELDRAALFGNGTVEPLGLRNWPGAQVIDLGPNGAPITDHKRFSEAVQRILEKNGPDAGLAAIYAPRTAGSIDRFADSTGQPLQAPESFARLRKLPTSQVPINLTKGTATNASVAFVGDFRQLMIGMRTQLALEVSRQAADGTSSAFRDLQIWIRGYLRADVAVSKPEHFVVIDGITP
ncbi:MAG: phage major capsid protein [Bacillota bacterium]